MSDASEEAETYKTSGSLRFGFWPLRPRMTSGQLLWWSRGVMLTARRHSLSERVAKPWRRMTGEFLLYEPGSKSDIVVDKRTGKVPWTSSIDRIALK